MKITEKKLAELIPYERNAKQHDQTQIANVAKSIDKYGFVQPIVIDKDNVIVIGHCRALAAKKLGLETVPTVSVENLTEEEVNALRIVDNKTNESPWDFELLKEELKSISIDMTEFGFDMEEKAKPERPEVEFSEILNEANNYVVLQFKTEVDWLNALTILELEPSMAWSTRKDGKITKTMRRIGVGRVLDGATVLKKLVGEI